MATPLISIDDVTVGESDGIARFTVSLSEISASTVTVQYFSTSGTAGGGGFDFNTTGTQTLTFLAGQLSKTVDVSIINDAGLEFTESFFVSLQSPVNALIGRAVGTATIMDNDAAAGTPVVTINDFVVDEAAQTATFVITLDRPGSGPVSLNYSTVDGTAIAGSDYVATNGTLIFAAGQTAKTVKVNLLNDTAAELSEAFSLTLSGLVGATTADPIGTALIYENDATPQALPSLTIEDVTVGESDTYADFLVRLNAPSTGNVSVQYFSASGTAGGGGFDFESTGIQTLNFAPGEMVKTVRVTISQFQGLEFNENFFVNLQNASGAVIARGVGTGTIIDNDAPAGTPVASVTDFVIDEADKTASFVITLDRPSTGVVSMNYATANGSALAGSDFVATSGKLSFAPGETAKTVKVTLLNDATAESGEAFNLVLSGLVGVTALDTSGTAVINENDGQALATPGISIDDVTVSEADAFANFLVRLNGPSTGNVSVQYFSTSGTAGGGGFDFESTGTQTLNFAAGETVKTIRVSISQFQDLESLESFTVILQNPLNAQIIRGVGTGTIVDNDAAVGTPVVSMGDVVLDEATGLVHVSLTLDKPKATSVTVKLAMQGVTAGDGSDVRSFSNLTVGFAPGETAKQVVLGVLNDALLEAAEVFDVAITSATGATIGDGRGHVIIAGNDAAAVATPTVSISGAAAAENDGFVDFLVSLSAPSTNTVTVQAFSTGGTALAGGFDFETTGLQTLRFAPGETIKNVRVQLVNDTAVEPLENFTITLQNPTSAVLGNTTATGTIVDDDSPAPASVPIAGTPQADILRGTRFADAITGGNGNDFIDGGAGNDTMDGGAGDDIYIVEQTGDVIVDASGTDKVIAYATYTMAANLEELLLAGTAAINGTGNAGSNLITGNAAANVINGGVGNDTMVGGAGNDTYVVDTIGDVITELANGGVDTVQTALTYTLGAQLENLTLTGIGAVNGTGNTLDNTIQGNAGNNVLNGVSGVDTVSYANATAAVTVSLAIVGAQNTVGAGTDTLLNFDNLTGSNFADTLTGDANANVLNGGAGIDTMTGGAGNDTYVIDTLSDVIVEAAGGGSDTVQAAFSYTLSGNLENVTLTGTAALTATGTNGDNILIGNSGANTLTGLDGNDRLDAGTGNDTMIGGLGNDTYVVNAVGDVITEIAGQGIDTVESTIAYTLGATLENLTLTGSGSVAGTGNTADNVITGNGGANTLLGLDGADTLIGNAGNDNLQGGIGNDRLVGGAGNDALNGGTGLDKFVFNAPLSATTNVDTIADFTLGQDQVVLSKSIFAALNGVNVTLDATQFFSGAGATAGADASDRIVYNSSTGNLYYDVDGAGGSASVLFGKLTGLPAIGAANIFVET